MNTKPRPWLILASLAFGLAGCSSVATPQLIASAPLSESPSNAEPLDGKSMPRAVHAFVEIEVADVDTAAVGVREIAWEYDGRIIDSTGWETGGCCRRQITITIPTSHYPAMLRALACIGNILREEGGTPPDGRFHPDDRDSQSTLTVHLVSRAADYEPQENRIVDACARLAALWESVQRSIFQIGLIIFACIAGLIPVALMGIGLTTCLRWLSRR
jgi:hypothetical protein